MCSLIRGGGVVAASTIIPREVVNISFPFIYVYMVEHGYIFQKDSFRNYVCTCVAGAKESPIR